MVDYIEDFKIFTNWDCYITFLWTAGRGLNRYRF